MTYIEEYYQWILKNPDKVCHKVKVVYQKLVHDIYYPEEEDSRLDPITTEKEWKVIETILSTLQEEIQKKDSDDEQ